MTRINTIDPRFLSDKHLGAEYRELPRILNDAKKRIESAIESNNWCLSEVKAGVANLAMYLPLRYHLGQGHVLFFRDKLGWLYRRHLQLIAELQFRAMLRGSEPFKPSIDLGPTFVFLRTYAPGWCGDWAPLSEDHATLLMRLIERMAEAKDPVMIAGWRMETRSHAAAWAMQVMHHHGVGWDAMIQNHINLHWRQDHDID